MKKQDLTVECLKAIENILKKEPLKLDLVDSVSDGIFCSLLANSLLNVDPDKRLQYVEYRMRLLSGIVDASVQAVIQVESNAGETIH